MLKRRPVERRTSIGATQPHGTSLARFSIEQGGLNSIAVPLGFSLLRAVARHVPAAKLDRQLRSVFILSLALLILSLAASREAIAKSPVDEFKSFVSNTPPIEEIVYRVKLLANPKRPDLGVAGSQYHELYVARWQSNAWVVRAVSPFAKLDSSKVTGRNMYVFENSYWLLEPGVAIRWVDDEPVVDGVKIEIPGKMPNRIRTAARFVKQTLTQALNMGIYNLEPGTIQWEENRFRGYFKEKRQTIEGTLAVGERGFPAQLEIIYTIDTNTSRYLVKYGYTNTLCLPIPSQIQVFKTGEESNIQMDDIAILSLTVSGRVGLEEDFNPTHLIALNNLARRYFTNGALYAHDKNSRLVLAPEPSPPRPPEPNSPLFYAVFLGASGGFLVLIVRARGTGIKQKIP